MIDFDLDRVVDFLEADTTLTDLIGSVEYENGNSPAIYRGIPESEDVEGIYIILSEDIDLEDSIISNETTVQVRIVSGSEKTTYAWVKAVDNRVKELLKNNFDYGTLKVYNVVVKSGRELLNDKDRKEYVRDYDFTFLQ